MRPDQKWAEDHGMTLREFQRAILNAQGKIMRGETPTDQERAAYEYALNGDGTTQSGEMDATVPTEQ